MPLGAHVVYEVEIAAGTLLKVSESREGHGVHAANRRAGAGRADLAGCLSRFSALVIHPKEF